jgi:hypothetical protein
MRPGKKLAHGVTAADPALYQIDQQGAALEIVSARFAGNKRTVELTTAVQNGGAYSLTVNGVSDLAGNAPSGGRVQFLSTPSTLDTDGDGVTDSDERAATRSPSRRPPW